MLLVRAERANIARRVVNEAMSNHFIFAPEAIATYASRTGFDGAVVKAIFCVGNRVGAGERVSNDAEDIRRVWAMFT